MVGIDKLREYFIIEKKNFTKIVCGIEKCCIFVVAILRIRR